MNENLQLFKANEVLQYKFITIPKELFVNPKYSHLSSDSKLLYGFILDRFHLSIQNNWKDENDNIYKQKRKNNMIFEEINFLARNNFKSVHEVKNYMDNQEKQLPKLKGRRELLWRKHKSTNENDKAKILAEINSLTDKIDTIQSQKMACKRIISKYKEFKEEYKKEIESKEKSRELIVADKKKRLKNR